MPPGTSGVAAAVWCCRARPLGHPNVQRPSGWFCAEVRPLLLELATPSQCPPPPPQNRACLREMRLLPIQRPCRDQGAALPWLCSPASPRRFRRLGIAVNPVFTGSRPAHEGAASRRPAVALVVSTGVRPCEGHWVSIRPALACLRIRARFLRRPLHPPGLHSSIAFASKLATICPRPDFRADLSADASAGERKRDLREPRE